MVSTAPSPASPCVGIVLWRPTPLGREVATLEVDGYLVLPKGRVAEHEAEEDAARRVAARLAGARVRGARPLPPGQLGRARLGWWALRWDGLEPSASEAARARWLPATEAAVRLDHREERERVADAGGTWLERLRERRERARARAARATLEEIEELEGRLRARPERPDPAFTPGAGWRGRALERAARARAALADGDAELLRRALAEARRLELYGLGASERALVAHDLEQRVELEAPAQERAGLRSLLRAPFEVERLAHAALALDRAREARAALDEARRAERTELASLAGLTLLAVWVLGGSSWFAAGLGATPGSATPPDVPLSGVLLFGLLGGIASATLAPGSAPRETARGAPSLRAVLGASVALVAFTLVRAGFVALPVGSTPGWLALAFGAGFLERALRRRPVSRYDG